uniref:Uncharacterized protein n=1 Tax=Picea glauca TaxID=3330 RepID=A0A117NH16_PICGL|nr:hypothetical protein ABT39_MTgene5892 [Picea glauca]
MNAKEEGRIKKLNATVKILQRKAFALFGYVIVDHLTVFIVRWALQSRRGSSMKLFSSHPNKHWMPF